MIIAVGRVPMAGGKTQVLTPEPVEADSLSNNILILPSTNHAATPSDHRIRYLVRLLRKQCVAGVTHDFRAYSITQLSPQFAPILARLKGVRLRNDFQYRGRSS